MNGSFSLILLFFSYSVFAITQDLGEKTQYFFKNLNKNTMNLVSDFYAKDIYFEDPLGNLTGLESMIAYYENLYENVQEIDFHFSRKLVMGNTVVAVWTMKLKAPKLNGGEIFEVQGNSVIDFDEFGQAIRHRDYFDMGEFIYERIPVLKSIIGYLKKRLKSS